MFSQVLQLSSGDYFTLLGIVTLVVVPAIGGVIHNSVKMAKIETDIKWIKQKLGYAEES